MIFLTDLFLLFFEALMMPLSISAHYADVQITCTGLLSPCYIHLGPDISKAACS